MHERVLAAELPLQHCFDLLQLGADRRIETLQRRQRTRMLIGQMLHRCVPELAAGGVGRQAGSIDANSQHFNCLTQGVEGRGTNMAISHSPEGTSGRAVGLGITIIG